MKVQFLSVNGWKPERAEEDTVSLMINGSIMVDTGWACVRNLLRAGKTPEDVRLLLFSHMHQDHYISLPAFVFYLLNSRHDASGVRILGPQRVEEVVELSLTLAGKHIHYRDCPPPIYGQIGPGETIEAEGVRIETCQSHHAAPGLCYRFTDLITGGSFVYTGDTAPTEEIARFAKGCDILVHEQSRGPKVSPDAPNPPLHSSACDAARCAREAGCRTLYLVHAPGGNRAESLRAAGEIFPACVRPNNMDVFEV